MDVQAKKKHLKEKAGFASLEDLVAWARGQIVISVGEGNYRTTVYDVVTTAIVWGQEVERLNVAEAKKK